MSNPLLEPIHGISLRDYAAISAKMASGVEESEICRALSIEPPVLQEASTLWIARMREDSTWEVTTLFGQYFGEVDNHPVLSKLQANVSEKGKVNIEKMKTDRYFYEELNGARQAAYAYGYDGAQWILDNFGINLGDFQAVAMHWMKVQNEEMAKGNNDYIMHFIQYQQQMKEEYSKKFAAEQGGNVADDVQF